MLVLCNLFDVSLKNIIMKASKLNWIFLFIFFLSIVTTCTDTEERILSSDAAIEQFAFLPEFNSDLEEAITGKISDYNITLSVPYKVELSELVATFNFTGAKIEVKNEVQVSNVTKNNFSEQVVYTVTAENGDKTEYSVAVAKNVVRIPRVHINTENFFEFADQDKETYVNATIKVEDLDNYYTSTTELISEGEIKGRGNSTWWDVPKKPYRIKLESNNRLLGMSNERNWALLANYFDKTLLRNQTAFEISRIADMSWTPKSISVDYYMNGTYRGVYTLTEHVRVSEERLNLDIVSSGDNAGEALTGDYFLELDFHYDEPFKFMTGLRYLPIMFKDPEEPTPAQFKYVEDFFNSAEEVLYSEDFLDA